MSGWKVFWAVLAALFVFSFVALGLTNAAIGVAQDQAAARVQAMQKRWARDAAQRRYQRAVREARDRASRALSPSQRCVGGTVVDVAHGAYVQRLQSGHPVRCRGRMAEVPIR